MAINLLAGAYQVTKSLTPSFVQESLSYIESLVVTSGTHVLNEYVDHVAHKTIDEAEIFFNEILIERDASRHALVLAQRSQEKSLMKTQQSSLQERLKELWRIMLEYLKSRTPEKEQQIIISIRDNYFSKILGSLNIIAERKSTPETLRRVILNLKSLLEFCLSPSSGKPALLRKTTIFFIEDEEEVDLSPLMTPREPILM